MGIGNFFSKIGHWITDGLLGGLKKGWDKVKGFAGKMAGGIKSTFKSILGINSPSRVFAAYGGFIGEGLLQGIEGQEGAINNKFGGLASKIKGLGNVRPNFNFGGLNDVALSGTKDSYGKATNSNKQFNFTPNITMHIKVSDTGAKGTEQLTNELKSMTESALKNGMVDMFLKDIYRL